jgi:hypothetical protein
MEYARLMEVYKSTSILLTIRVIAEIVPILPSHL